MCTCAAKTVAHGFQFFLGVAVGTGVKIFQAEIPGVCSSGRTTSRPQDQFAHT